MVQTSGTTINVVKGGEGPPLLLLHGAPQSHLSWRLVLRSWRRIHVVATDLRGYGDSGKLPDTADHSNYSKRNMALDQVEVMRHFGFDRFPVVGHDRGGRVAHRMALDHPDKVTKVAVLDIIPTYYLYTHVTLEFVQAYFHWFNYLRPAPGPENDLMAQARRRRRARPLRSSSSTCARPAILPTSTPCAKTIGPPPRSISNTTKRICTKIAAPLLTLWGEKGAMGRLYDVLSGLARARKRGQREGLPGAQSAGRRAGPGGR